MLSLWFPFIKDITQQGLSSASITAVGSGASLNDNGKLGKCYYFDGTGNGYMITDFSTNIGTADFSISVWVKIPTITSGTYFAIFTSKTTAATVVGFRIYWNYSQKKFLWSTADGSASTEIWMATAVDDIVYDKWIHLVMVRNSSDPKIGYFYINGVRYELASVPVIRNIATSTNLNIGRTTNGSYPCKMYMNDLRIYVGEALSSKEVKLLSQGLVCHYKLDDRQVQVMDNCFVYPTFDTTNTTGGWYHWGGSGHQATFGQNTDPQYIFKSGQTYSHWVANGSSATYDYLCYQSPAFEGGYRSLCCIIKHENSLPITNSICYPTWNDNVSGGTTLNQWTSVVSLNNGFYLCKCEGIKQGGSNDLAGIHVKAGNKIYISECYLENDRTCCSDIFGDTTTVYDCSGYNYHGTKTGDLTVSSDTSRYSLSTHFNGTSYSYLTSISPEIVSISLWVKWDSIPSGQSVVFMDYKSRIGFGLMNTGILCGSVSGTYNTFSKSNIVANTWYHFVIVSPNGATNNARKLYINGVEQTATSNISIWSYGIDQLQIGRRSTTSDGFVGKISDFRAYATVLSADDIKELYQTSASIDKNGNFYAYELKEV